MQNSACYATLKCVDYHFDSQSAAVVVESFV